MTTIYIWVCVTKLFCNLDSPAICDSSPSLEIHYSVEGPGPDTDTRKCERIAGPFRFEEPKP